MGLRKAFTNQFTTCGERATEFLDDVGPNGVQPPYSEKEPGDGRVNGGKKIPLLSRFRLEPVIDFPARGKVNNRL
jgi:hypothetical protein